MSRQNYKKSYNKPRQDVYEYVTKEEFEQSQVQQKQEEPKKQQPKHSYNNEKQQYQPANQRQQNQKPKYKHGSNQTRFHQDSDYRRDEQQFDEETHNFDITKIQQKELTNVLIKLLKYKKIECPICYDKVHQSQKIWSCAQCYQPFHLQCTHKWIKNLNPVHSNELMNWSCPKCNMLYQDKLPEYTCFCKKQKEPEADSYSIPHSCSQVCGKKRGQFCPHPCPMNCHPGPCPECHVQGVEIKCFCGKKAKQMQCSEIKKDFACGQPCEKKLNCQKHTCQKLCHNGTCPPCQEVHEVQCYCGTEVKTINCADESYSCGKRCDKALDCGNHQCLELCHPKCQPCKLKPELIIRCACGKYPLADLLKEPRKSCLDPIPNCGTPIETILKCGHKSRTICGSDYPECIQKVKQKCRCGDTTRIKLCNDESKFVCDGVCKKRKSCGVHFCQKECCPPNDQEQHLCLKVCNKLLTCGKHNCDQFCHIGACQPCPITILQPITCPCGKSVKNPPQKCGTAPPACMQTCDKMLECGHKCKSLCHPGQCPSCLEQTEKLCRCKSQTLSTICSKIAICRNICNKQMLCGHKCPEVCQEQEQCPGNVPEGCGQKCNARKACGHHCQEFCHPNQQCPRQPCKIQIRVVCSCGNRDTFTECGAIDEPVEKTLKCDQKCQNIKRFGAFYKSNSLVDIEKTYYPDILLKYTHYNLQSLQKMEEKIEHFLVNSKPEDAYDFSFPRSEWAELKKLALQILFSRHYKFEVQILKTSNKQYMFSLFKTQDTSIPKVKLSEYFIKVQKGIIKRDHQPFKAKIRTSYDISQADQINLENSIIDFKGDYYCEKQGQCFTLNFWDETAAENALKKLKKVVGLLNVNWTLEMNQQSLDEDKRITEPAKDNEIIVKRRKIKQIEYETQDLEIKYSKQEEEQFQKVQEQYKEKATLIKKCDEEEINERIEQEQLSIFEQDGFYQYEFKPIRENIVRCFREEQKPLTPEYVRTPDTLCKTVDFLLQNFIDADHSDSDFKKPMVENTPRDITFEDIYAFIHDRLSQIRVELNHLQYKNEDVYVKIIRFYVISHSQLRNNTENLTTLCTLLKEFQNPETLQYNLLLSSFQQDIPICQNFLSDLQSCEENESLDENLKQLVNLSKQIQSQQYPQYLEFYSKCQNECLKSLMFGFLNLIKSKIIEQLSKTVENLDENQQKVSINKIQEALQLKLQNELITLFKNLEINTEKLEEQILEQNDIEFDILQHLQKLKKEKPFQQLEINRLSIFN